MKQWIKITELRLLMILVAVQDGDFTYTTNEDNTTGYADSGDSVTVIRI